MANISLSKALKYRKRVQAAIAKVSADIQTSNVVTALEGKEPKWEVDPKQLMVKHALFVQHLIDLEVMLNAANVKIQGKIIKLRELKGFVGLLKKIPTDHGPQLRYYGGDVPATVSHAAYRKNDIDEMVRKTELEIDSIQDELDAFNATTKIDLPNFGIVQQG